MCWQVMLQVWNYSFPLNKKLWTSSYVLYTTGIDLVTLGILYYLFEIRSWKAGLRFFSVSGRNALFIYILSNIFIIFFIIQVAPGINLFDWVNKNIFQIIAPGSFGSLLFALSFTIVCRSIGWILDKKKIYIRI